jgi:predicted  nucleic acid-binding Zn-ribbon protein
LQKQIDDLEHAKQMSEDATRPLEAELVKLQNQLTYTAAAIKKAEAKNLKLQEDIHQRETDFKQSYLLLAERAVSYYKTLRTASPFLIIFSSSRASDLTKNLSYQQQAQNRDKDEIERISEELATLAADKKKVEADRVTLATLKVKYQEQAAFFDKEIKGAKAYQQDLNQQIAQLSTRQQEILAARAGSFTTSVGDVPLTDDPNASPAYNPGFSPAFAAFSFGAYTHRKGMSQYGAKGRAEAGQDYRQILQAYYHKDPVGKDTGGTIGVDGFGNLDFENYYLMGIAEMPSTFPKEALKAQAIAARSYAYRYKAEGKSICTTQACQVFSNSKAANPPGEWKQAVEETRGQIVEDVVAYYSSTTGGYITTMGWDTTDGQSGGDWTNRAYEAKAKSPWFYKGWYTADYYNDSAKCGRSHPWLNQEEMADILNAYIVLKNGSQEEVDRILPITIGECSISGSSGNPFSQSEMKDKAGQWGGGYNSISGVSTTHSTNGETSQVVFETDKGSVPFSGSEFKQAFNLRAPGYISIRSPLYQIEKK